MSKIHVRPDGEYRFVFAGGSYATITTLKLLSSHIIPKLLDSNPAIKKVSVTVITPNRETYWNVASLRLITEPELLETNARQLFFSLESALRQHFPSDPRCKLRMIQGKVTEINAEKNTVAYLKVDDEGMLRDFNNFWGEKVGYDILFIATGASSSAPAFKLNSSALISKRSLKRIHDSVHKANSIAIVGAGGVGVELAGELGFKYGKTKQITVYSDTHGALDHLKPKLAVQAIKQLEDLNVRVVTETQVVSIQHNDGYSTRINGTTDLARNRKQNGRDSQLHTSELYEEKHNISETPSSPPYKKQGHSHHRISRKLKIKTHHSQTPHSSHVRYVSHASNASHDFHDTHIIHDDIHKTHDATHSYSTTNELSDSDSSQVSRDTDISNDSTLYYDESGKTNPNSAKFNSSTPKYTGPKTIITFADGAQDVVDCCIPATGNIPNTSFLSYEALDEAGYVRVDSNLRMLYKNPLQNIYVVGDLISGGRETINDITTAQRQTLKATLYHDLIDSHAPLKEYVMSAPSYMVVISKNGGVGTLNGFSVPSFVVTWMKARNYRMYYSKRYLE